MAEPISNNKRIAKNTALLYFRQILIMLVSLYTVRVVLKVLGVEDYGIYNVVGGIVTMFSFLSGTMASASQRYFAYDLGRKDYDSLNKTFSLTFLSYIGIAAFIFLICEIGGVWFVNNKMTIPPDRLSAAIWTLQAALLSFILTIMNLPYMAVLIAREKMDAYAYISILEAGLKLLIVLALQWIDFDKLKIYAILTVCSTALITLTYRVYCKRYFKESHFKYYWDWARLKDILSYAGWNMIGSIAGIFRNQGVNILLNIFFNPVINAARGVAFQVQGAVNSLVTNLYTSSRPQITKYYAENKIEEMWQLVFSTAKVAFYFLMLISILLSVHVEFILGIWIGDYPEYLPLFLRLTLLTFLIETSCNQLISVLQASKKIKRLQLSSSIIQLLNLPVAYLFLKLGYPPQAPFIISAVLSIVYVASVVIIVKLEMGLSIRRYTNIILRMVLSTIVVYLIVDEISSLLPHGFIQFSVSILTLGIVGLSTIWLIGLESNEKSSIKQYLKVRVPIL